MGQVKKEAWTAVWNIEFIFKNNRVFFVFTFLSVQYK